MGIMIPQVITPSKASGAQVIDGSVGIRSDREYHLERDPGSAGNRKTFTFSGWVKKHQATTGEDQAIIEARTSSPSADGDIFGCRFEDDARISVYDYGNLYVRSGVGRMRDTNGWYHIFFSVDTTVASNNVKLYVNNVLVGQGSHAQNTDTRFNSTDTHRIGARDDGSENYWLNAALTNFYVIDGQALEPTDFGFTDPLTNTWKPKKYTGTFGTNGFYLPMDGNSPIGEDKSGQGNNWTPVNFGGTVALDNPIVSGARPILNTLPGGTQAGVGVFGSKQNVGYAVTVYNDGGGNKYYIDGVKQATLTGLIRGATYTFDTSDSTVSSHPFRFSESDGGSQYTNGVVAITGAATTITIPYNSSNELYYYCTSHSGMGSSITGITTNEKLADQYASNCVLAAPLIFRDMGDVSASIACTSSSKSMSNNGDATDTEEQSNFYNRSFEFDGTGDYIDVTESDNCFDFGTGDFTIELWALLDNNNDLIGTANNSAFLGSNKGGWVIRRFDQGIKFNYQYNGSWVFENTFGSEGSRDKWNHIAITREGSTIRCFSNGVQQGSDYTSSANIVSTEGYCRIGGGYNSTSLMVDGYIQDVRIYKGVAKYTSNFVVPATSPDILPDTPSGVAGGSKLTKITDGAITLDKSGDCLTVADDADFEFGSGDFTLEAFIYYTGNPGTSNNTYAIFSKWDNQSAPNDKGFILRIGDSGSGDNLQWFYSTDGSTNLTTTASTLLNPNNWYHIAFVRNGSYGTFYVNGVADATVVSFGSNSIRDTGNAFRIGANLDSGSVDQEFSGFISNARVVKGTAVYTGNRFTPPAAPLTNVTNTKLLCCQSNTLAGSAAVVPGASGINDGTPWSEFVTVSEGITGTNYNNDASNWFDGDTSTSASLFSGNMVSPYSPTTVVFAPPSPITVSTGVRVYMAIDRGQNISINGTETNASVSAGWNDTGFTGTLTSLTLGPTNAGSSSNPAALEIDGVILKNLILPKGDTAATTFNPFNTDINTVRGQETGYATLNPLAENNGAILSDANLETTFTTASSTGTVPGTIFVDNGKWYCEVTIEEISGISEAQIGIIREDDRTNRYIGATGTNGYGYEPYRDRKYGPNAANSSGIFGTTYTSGTHHYAMALDLDEGTLDIYKEGILQGELQSGISGRYTFAVADIGGSDYPVIKVNFGQKPFKFPPPEGYQSLNTATTRPVNVISRPDQFVGVTTYAGDGTSVVVSDYQFKPDLVWIKGYTDADRHGWYDSVRGVQKRLQPAHALDQDTQNGVMSFDDNGFSVGDYAETNGSGRGYVAWSWKAGGDKNTFNVDDVGYATAAAAGLTGGSYSLTGASVGTKQGFSIVQWTHSSGTAGTINHGLLEAPTFIIYKSSANDTRWTVGHNSLGWSTGLVLDVTDAKLADDPAYFNSTPPTSSVFSIGDTGQIGNGNALAYCWHNVPGLQKFGQYEGSNSTDGAFVELGFRPALLIVKNIDAGSSLWLIADKERNKFNPINSYLQAQADDDEYGPINGDSAYTWVDFLSNGFKLRKDGASLNALNTYIYAAWAEAPTVDLFGGGANAR